MRSADPEDRVRAAEGDPLAGALHAELLQYVQRRDVRRLGERDDLGDIQLAEGGFQPTRSRLGGVAEPPPGCAERVAELDLARRRAVEPGVSDQVSRGALDHRPERITEAA